MKTGANVSLSWKWSSIKWTFGLSGETCSSSNPQTLTSIYPLFAPGPRRPASVPQPCTTTPPSLAAPALHVSGSALPHACVCMAVCHHANWLHIKVIMPELLSLTYSHNTDRHSTFLLSIHSPSLCCSTPPSSFAHRAGDLVSCFAEDMQTPEEKPLPTTPTYCS